MKTINPLTFRNISVFDLLEDVAFAHEMLRDSARWIDHPEWTDTYDSLTAWRQLSEGFVNDEIRRRILEAQVAMDVIESEWETE